MNNLKKLIKNHKYLVFVDFEATQFSQEMIAIGAVIASIDKNGKIKKLKAPYRRYVLAKNKIGPYVIKLTGITEEKLKKEGMLFDLAMRDFCKYCGRIFTKASFITFGNHDLRILNQSISYNLSYPKEITQQIQKNYFDFTVLLNEFAKDENGNALSLMNACKLFNVNVEGQPHDPEYDAINLAKLYDAFLKNKEIILKEYLKILSHGNNMPVPVKKAVEKLTNGEEVTPLDLEQFCRDYIND